MIQPPALQQLRSQVARIIGLSRHTAVAICPTGVAEIDARLPGRGLALGAIHEFIGDLTAITGFLAALLGRHKAFRQVLWVTPDASLFAPGLSQLGLDHRRLTIAWARRRDDRLWATEEGLRELGYGAVVAEAETVDLTASRRLQLAAEASGSIGFIICRDRQPSAALTRWLVEPARSQDCSPHWKLTLERCRGTESGGTWKMGWDHASLSFRLAAAMAYRPTEEAAE
ncbi:ImuA family protein [Ferrovibrio xuzhouensis]|uniref:ImuA family protein n=1 Tax=Ferrovibrio xuzhouensis TaxID=1576914 RepID=A0ABV7VML7_9PROT